MTPATLALAGLVLVLAVALVIVAWPRRVRKVRRVFVALSSGQTVEGLLVRRLPDRLLLEAATIHAEGGAQTSVDGTVELDRERITWVQVL